MRIEDVPLGEFFVIADMPPMYVLQKGSKCYSTVGVIDGGSKTYEGIQYDFDQCTYDVRLATPKEIVMAVVRKRKKLVRDLREGEVFILDGLKFQKRGCEMLCISIPNNDVEVELA